MVNKTLFNPFMLPVVKQHPGDLDEILWAKAHLGKYLKEKYCSEHYQLLSKYFVKLFSVPKLSLKVS